MILVYTEINKGKVKKASLEAVNYAAKIAELTGSSVTAVAINADAAQLEDIGKAGAKKILSIKNDFWFINKIYNNGSYFRIQMLMWES